MPVYLSRPQPRARRRKPLTRQSRSPNLRTQRRAVAGQKATIAAHSGKSTTGACRGGRDDGRCQRHRKPTRGTASSTGRLVRGSGTKHGEDRCGRSQSIASNLFCLRRILFRAIWPSFRWLPRQRSDSLSTPGTSFFLSDDAGRHWKPVPVPWKGHAVRVALTSPVPVGNAALALEDGFLAPVATHQVATLSAAGGSGYFRRCDSRCNRGRHQPQRRGREHRDYGQPGAISHGGVASPAATGYKCRQRVFSHGRSSPR